MSNRPQEKSYFMTPDSLRAYLHLMEQLYNSHTSVNMGIENADGTQYSGTIENFGSEILMEASKMKLRKPPIDSLLIPSIVKYYFDVQYSEYIDTYDQQYMMCGMLRDNVIYNTWEYTLTLSDLEIEYVVRSESSSDPVVRCDAFYVTETPPVLTIEDDEGNVNEYEVYITDQNYISAKYYFPINALTDPLHDTVVDGTLTIDLKRNKIVNAPYFWFCVPSFRHLPYINMTGNADYSGAKLLTIGNNGHDVPFMFPCVQSDHNVPSNIELEGYEWYVKVYGDFQELGNNNYNYTIKVLRIEYIYSSPETLMTATPEFVKEIEYDDSYTKLVLAKYVGVNWRFHTPVPGDYDYDGETYNNPCYAYIPLSTFESNSEHENLIPIFKVIFDERRYIESSLDVHTNEILMNHGVSGVHIDFGTDYADHPIYKEKGLIHELSEFDGLPTYLSDWMEKETHRGHVELYTISDNLTKNTPMNRQTAAIIIDTAVPPNDMEEITMDLPVVIKYQGEGIYDTIGESPSPVNYLSELGYYSKTLFPNTVGIPDHPEYKNLTKFIYHGDGVFSLKPIEFDPQLQFGRVYTISNDPASYENNELTENPKAGRTMARICDIPTSYIQIISIEGHSPTYALDPYYVRQYASLTDNDQYEYIVDQIIVSKDQNDLDLLWNERTPDILEYQSSDDFYLIFPYVTTLRNIMTSAYIHDNYPHYTSLNEYLDMSNMLNPTTFTLTINDGGTGYDEGDTFNMLIGGINFKGTVESVDSGVVQSVSFANDDDGYYYVNQGNITSNPYLCKTTTTSGEGNGLRLNLEIDADEWARLKRHTDGILPDRYALVKDSYEWIWIYKWNENTDEFEKYKQFTGYPYEFNVYDDYRFYGDVDIHAYPPDQEMRSLKDVIIYNDLRMFYHDDLDELKPHHVSKVISDFTGDYTSAVDYSDILSTKYNFQESYSYITGDGINTYDELYKLLPEDNTVEYPAFHRGNTYTINTSACGITPVFAENKQPFVFYYNAGNEDFETLTDVMDGVSLISSRKLTFKDIFPSTIFSGNYLACNVYSYSLWNDVKEFDARRSVLDTKTYEELIEILQVMYDNCEPIQVYGTIDQYPIEKLKDYIMQREILTPRYYHEDTKLLRSLGEQVVDYSGIQVVPVGEQPHGGFIDITNERRDPFVYINHRQFNSNPSYVFRLDGDIPSLNGFKMYDSEGRDISENCVLIVNYVPYVYINSTWVQLSTQTN